MITKTDYTKIIKGAEWDRGLAFHIINGNNEISVRYLDDYEGRERCLLVQSFFRLVAKCPTLEDLAPLSDFVTRMLADRIAKTGDVEVVDKVTEAKR